jgi:hypothetical protein
VAVPSAPVRVPSQRPLAPSVASVTLVVNNKGDDEMILGAVHKSPGICLTAVENHRKPQLGDSLMKGLCDQSLPQIGSLFSQKKVGRIAQQVRKGEGRKVGKEQVGQRTIPLYCVAFLIGFTLSLGIKGVE